MALCCKQALAQAIFFHEGTPPLHKRHSTWLLLLSLVQVPANCSSGIVDAKQRCCPSGLVDSSSTCCEQGTSLDRAGRCCARGTLDACGVCDGNGTAVDVEGTCCNATLDASGLCCMVCSWSPTSCYGSDIDTCASSQYIHSGM